MTSVQSQPLHFTLSTGDLSDQDVDDLDDSMPNMHQLSQSPVQYRYALSEEEDDDDDEMPPLNVSQAAVPERDLESDDDEMPPLNSVCRASGLSRKSHPASESEDEDEDMPPLHAAQKGGRHDASEEEEDESDMPPLLKARHAQLPRGHDAAFDQQDHAADDEEDGEEDDGMPPLHTLERVSIPFELSEEVDVRVPLRLVQRAPGTEPVCESDDEMPPLQTTLPGFHLKPGLEERAEVPLDMDGQQSGARMQRSTHQFRAGDQVALIRYLNLDGERGEVLRTDLVGADLKERVRVRLFGSGEAIDVPPGSLELAPSDSEDDENWSEHEIAPLQSPTAQSLQGPALTPRDVSQAEGQDEDGSHGESQEAFAYRGASLECGFEVGDEVILTGLRCVTLNGERCRVLPAEEDTADGRLVVQLDSSGHTLSVKPLNLKPAPPVSGSLGNPDLADRAHQERYEDEESPDDMPPLHSSESPPCRSLLSEAESGGCPAEDSRAQGALTVSAAGQDEAQNTSRSQGFAPGDRVRLCGQGPRARLTGQAGRVLPAAVNVLTSGDRLPVQLEESGQTVSVRPDQLELASDDEASDDSMPPVNAATQSTEKAPKAQDKAALVEEDGEDDEDSDDSMPPLEFIKPGSRLLQGSDSEGAEYTAGPAKARGGKSLAWKEEVGLGNLVELVSLKSSELNGQQGCVVRLLAGPGPNDRICRVEVKMLSSGKLLSLKRANVQRVAEDKDKKSKKSKKSDKKDGKKDDKKETKRAQNAEGWNCERGDAVKHMIGLLELDSNIDEELEGVFSAIDDGETIRLDGLENKQARKKLRHLLQAFRLIQEDGGQAYRSAEIQVSFSSIFKQCLEKSRAHHDAEVAAAGEVKAKVRAKIAEAAAKRKAEAKAFEAQRKADPRAGYDGEDDGLEEAALQAQPKKRVGPQLPGASVGAAFGEDTEEEEEHEDGPRIEGEERQGVDLRTVDWKSDRDEWMTMGLPGMENNMFVNGNGGVTSVKGEKFEVKRSQAEKEAFEKAFKERGPSLLEQQMDGKFVDAADEQERVKRLKVGPSELWGMSGKDQERETMRPGERANLTASRKTFDPEKDMRSQKPMSSDEFSKLVQNSKDGIGGRFSRGGFASSFL
ncbi:unnamed protein product [Polarella glacialis]|uniref:Uncharacterized protein n=1 Tax=Polarella glacialis TaxID=89957 RepID=A0A813ERJ0_POLGL|nr:unnamed protein product [Polarella glacialis]